MTLVAAYGAGVRRVGRRGRRWPAHRSVSFAAGAVAVAVAGVIPESTFTWHMAGHVLLSMVAPVLMVVSAPLTLALQAAGRGVRSRLLTALHTRPARVAAHPLVGWVLFGGTLVGFYLSPIFPLSLRSPALHGLTHLHFLLAGAVFAWPLVGNDPVPRPLPHGLRLLAVLAAVPFHAVLGMALLSSRSPLAPHAYPRLSDQRAAASLAWAAGELFAVALIGIAFFRWAAADRREADRLDRCLH